MRRGSAGRDGCYAIRRACYFCYAIRRACYSNHMKRINVDSDILRAVGYDRETETLEIEFNRGSIYQYLGVPEREYESLIIAISKGRYFQERIDGHYRFIRII